MVEGLGCDIGCRASCTCSVRGYSSVDIVL